jgi:hypothetical protein
MDELAAALLDEIEKDPELGDLWRKHRTQREHEWELKGYDSMTRLWLLLIQFADDITILASSPSQARRLLEITCRWAESVNLEISHKSQLVLLSAQSRSEARNLGCDEPLICGSVHLSWQMQESFRLLGVTCQAAFSRYRSGTALPIDSKEVLKHLAAVSLPFELHPEPDIQKKMRQQGQRRVLYVSPVMFRMGVEGMVSASALYQTPLIDVDYEELDSLILDATRRTMQLPPTTPTAYVQWELRLWPRRLRAHKRVLVFIALLLHHTRIGELILRPYLERDRRAERQLDDLHPIFSVPPLKRMTTILAEYKLSWFHALREWNHSWAKRDELRSLIEERYLLPRFTAEIVDSIESCTRGLPAYHRRQLLRDLTPSDGPDLAHRASLLPLYLYVPHDLPRAGTLFPLLRCLSVTGTD